MRRFPLLTSPAVSLGIAILLFASAALNAKLYLTCRELFFRLQETRLDPLQLSHYPTPGDNAKINSSGPPRVVFFGDSRAEMWPAPACDPERFQFFNRGIGSQTTEQMVLRFDAHLAHLQPNLVVIQAGMNDLRLVALFPGRRSEIVESCEANLRELVQRCRNLGAQVVITTIFGISDLNLEWGPFWTEDISRSISEVNHTIREMDGPGVVVLDAESLLADPGAPGHIRKEYRYQLDHLNSNGYAVLNSELLRLLHE